MKTKCQKQLGRILGKEDHQYAPCLEIKRHPKNVWQSPKKPFAHPKCISHLSPRWNPEEFLCMEKSLMDSKA